jgi:hypothetical protein
MILPALGTCSTSPDQRSTTFGGVVVIPKADFHPGELPTGWANVENSSGDEVVRVGSYSGWFPSSELAADLSLLRQHVVDENRTYLPGTISC